MHRRLTTQTLILTLSLTPFLTLTLSLSLTLTLTLTVCLALARKARGLRPRHVRPGRRRRCGEGRLEERAHLAARGHRGLRAAVVTRVP